MQLTNMIIDPKRQMRYFVDDTEMQGEELMQRSMVRQWFCHAILKIRVELLDRRIETVPCRSEGSVDHMAKTQTLANSALVT